jgi:hypothetical protein
MLFRVRHALLLCILSTIAHMRSAEAQDTRRDSTLASAARPGDELLGLWGAEQVLGPQVARK